MNRRGFMGAVLLAGVAPGLMLTAKAMPVRRLGSGVLAFETKLTWEELSDGSFSITGMYGSKDGKLWEKVQDMADFAKQDRIYYHRGGSRLVVKDRFQVMPSEAEAVFQQIVRMEGANAPPFMF